MLGTGRALVWARVCIHSLQVLEPLGLSAYLPRLTFEAFNLNNHGRHYIVQLRNLGFSEQELINSAHRLQTFREQAKSCWEDFVAAVQEPLEVCFP